MGLDFVKLNAKLVLNEFSLRVYMETTDLEYYGWLTAMLMFFIPPLIIFSFLKVKDSEMEWKRSIGFYFGWIPGNLISCWYLHYSIGIVDAFMLLCFTQIIQLAFVIVMGNVFIKMFGKNAFR